MPLQKTYAFENSAKLWLIYVILVASGLLVLIMYVKAMDYKYVRSQFLVWHSTYGLPGGLIYGIPLLLPFFFCITPAAAAVLFYFFSTNIIKRYEKLIPAEESDKITSSYRESISFFENALIRVLKAAELPSKPKVYIRNILQPNCYVFGRNPGNFSIAVTTGLLEPIKEGNITAEEVEAIISHEIGHVLNYDLRLASSIKIFSDLKVMKFVIIGIFAALIIILLSSTGLNLHYFHKNLTIIEKLSKGYEHLKRFYPMIPLFLILYIVYVAVELLIRTTFKAREFFADTQALKIFKDENVFVKTLERISSPFSYLTADSSSLAAIPYTIAIYWPLSATRFLFKILFFLPEGFQEKVTKKIGDLIQKLRTVYSTHPTLNQRTKAITNRTYFPKPPIHISYKAYLTVGITVFISFLFLTYSGMQLNAFSLYGPFLYFFYALPGLVIINNAHLRYLHKYDLQALKDSFFLYGFDFKPGLARDLGRKLFLANHLAHLPLAIFPLLLLTLFHFRLRMFLVMLALQFLLMHGCTFLFLKLLSWSKKA